MTFSVHKKRADGKRELSTGSDPQHMESPMMSQADDESADYARKYKLPGELAHDIQALINDALSLALAIEKLLDDPDVVLLLGRNDTKALRHFLSRLLGSTHDLAHRLFCEDEAEDEDEGG